MYKTPKLKFTPTKLSIEPLKANLIRHPSVKSLFDDNGNQKIPSNETNNSNELYTFNIKNSDIENDEEIKQKTNIETNVLIKIDKCEHKIVDNTETFFVDTGVTNPVISNSTKNINEKPAMYKFNNQQRELDDEVTKDMSEGKDYEIIEQKFLGLLKNKKH